MYDILVNQIKCIGCYCLFNIVLKNFSIGVMKRFEYYISIYFYMVQNINILDYLDNNIIIYHHILSGKRYKFFD